MEKKIYYHDTDCGGVVYYGRYLNYLEEARTEYLENRGISVKAIAIQGFFFAVRSCNIVYKSPARYGDVLVCDAVLRDQTPAQIIFIQEIKQKNSGKLVAKAEVALVCLDNAFHPVAIPNQIKENLR
jgi:acyl-CoA thioester hydrolase